MTVSEGKDEADKVRKESTVLCVVGGEGKKRERETGEGNDDDDEGE